LLLMCSCHAASFEASPYTITWSEAMSFHLDATLMGSIFITLDSTPLSLPHRVRGKVGRQQMKLSEVSFLEQSPQLHILPPDPKASKSVPRAETQYSHATTVLSPLTENGATRWELHKLGGKSIVLSYWFGQRGHVTAAEAPRVFNLHEVRRLSQGRLQLEFHTLMMSQQPAEVQQQLLDIERDQESFFPFWVPFHPTSATQELRAISQREEQHPHYISFIQALKRSGQGVGGLALCWHSRTSKCKLHGEHVDILPLAT